MEHARDAEFPPDSTDPLQQLILFVPLHSCRCCCCAAGSF